MCSVYSSFSPLLSRASPFVPPSFNSCYQESLEDLTENSRILIVGAGGLGCEILKNLSLSGYKELHLIDLDTIDVSNLNRQFLFRPRDCNQYKSTVAANFIMARIPSCKVKAYTKPIQSFSPSWYAQFDCIIAGLDNIEARQWLNQTIVNLVKYKKNGEIDYSSVIPFIDGGTEGFGGQARVFLSFLTSCFECSLASMPPQKSFPSCTIRNVPRLPEHCILYALKVLWPKLVSFNNVNEYEMKENKEEEGGEEEENNNEGVVLDKDNNDHMSWIYNRAVERGKQFNIAGTTYQLTLQVVKNIIPAISSTNAIIAAACCNEVFKFTTKSSFTLENYFMFQGGQATGTNTETIKYQRNPQCPVCQSPSLLLISNTTILEDFLSSLHSNHQLINPSISLLNGTSLYIKNLHSSYSHNLSRPIGELLKSGEIIITNDQNLGTKKWIVVFEEEKEEEEEGEEGEEEM